MRKNTYPLAAPEEFGLSTEAIQATIRDIRETQQLDLHSFLLLRQGHLLWEDYFSEGAPDKLHLLNSVSKTFTATAIGLAEAEGLLRLEEKLYDFFPEYAALCDSDYKKEITLQHLLTMSSGLEADDDRLSGHENLLNPVLLESELALPATHPPGTFWQYSSYSTFLLSAILSRVTGSNVHDYLRQKLFEPMDFGKTHWNLSPEGIPLGGFGLYMTSYDMTRLGQLYLQKGAWEGQQLLPSSYVARASAKQIDTAENGWADPDWHAGYGFQLWRNHFGGYRADGANGQYILVYPEKAIVLVMTAHLNPMQGPLTAVQQYLLQSVQ